MSEMLAFFLLVIILLAVAGGICLLLPTVGQAVERARVEREAAEASWRIHQQATEAFSQMLDAARESERQEES